MGQALAGQVEAMRRFNRFYTRKIGVLQEGLLHSTFTLAQGRVLYELACHPRTAANELAKRLDLDPGYLSRILRLFERRGLIDRQASPADGRQSLVSLTPAGQDAFAEINDRSRNEITAMLGALSRQDRHELIESMRRIETLFDTEPEGRTGYVLRPHRIGDMGWVVQSHGAHYALEYGWDHGFEALVAKITAAFLENYDPGHDRCWIAEIDGENVGSAFVVRQDERVAKLRMLLVEPRARGLGIGGRLVDECLRFAREAGYLEMTLWTNSILERARHLYVSRGFRLMAEEPHHSFGQALIGETWTLDLRAPSKAGASA